LPGDLQKTRMTRTGCPGVAASSHLALVAGQGCWSPWQLQLSIVRSQMQRSFGKRGAVLYASTSTVGLKRSFRRTSGDKGVQKPALRCGPGGWPGPHSIFWNGEIPFGLPESVPARSAAESLFCLRRLHFHERHPVGAVHRNFVFQRITCRRHCLDGHPLLNVLSVVCL